ncbi:hypothetical protein LELG_04207 [Lodderomyces elongisporus NRRL YB-4239]|uniref:Uncharacterized protein n=1 Tax=Lodderomyces elongisporus (strain ATCC 11503 / CBS 2605 / JCM 1781 / NBRC 1676 / NRRL YB-4239) TaxID=379508 RepID=A5E3L9_LODEL|nr:hypothetical protein LELG_04207 [Lodderomyces elongisporus NRRL YB-4239]
MSDSELDTEIYQTISYTQHMGDLSPKSKSASIKQNAVANQHDSKEPDQLQQEDTRNKDRDKTPHISAVEGNGYSIHIGKESCTKTVNAIGENEQKFLTSNTNGWIHGYRVPFSLITYKRSLDTSTKIRLDKSYRDFQFIFNPKYHLDEIEHSGFGRKSSDVSFSQEDYSPNSSPRLQKIYKPGSTLDSDAFMGYVSFPRVSFNVPNHVRRDKRRLRQVSEIPQLCYQTSFPVGDLTYLFGGLFVSKFTTFDDIGLPRNVDLNKISVHFPYELPPFVNTKLLTSPFLQKHPSLFIMNSLNNTVTDFDISNSGDFPGHLSAMVATKITPEHFFFYGGFEIIDESVSYHPTIDRWIIRKKLVMNQDGYILNTVNFKFTKIKLEPSNASVKIARIGLGACANIFEPFLKQQSRALSDIKLNHANISAENQRPLLPVAFSRARSSHWSSETSSVHTPIPPQPQKSLASVKSKATEAELMTTTAAMTETATTTPATTPTPTPPATTTTATTSASAMANTESKRLSSPNSNKGLESSTSTSSAASKDSGADFSVTRTRSVRQPNLHRVATTKSYDFAKNESPVSNTLSSGPTSVSENASASPSISMPTPTSLTTFDKFKKRFHRSNMKNTYSQSVRNHRSNSFSNKNDANNNAQNNTNGNNSNNNSGNNSTANSATPSPVLKTTRPIIGSLNNVITNLTVFPISSKPVDLNSHSQASYKSAKASRTPSSSSIKFTNAGETAHKQPPKLLVQTSNFEQHSKTLDSLPDTIASSQHNKQDSLQTPHHKFAPPKRAKTMDNEIIEVETIRQNMPSLKTHTFDYQAIDTDLSSHTDVDEENGGVKPSRNTHSKVGKLFNDVLTNISVFIYGGFVLNDEEENENEEDREEQETKKEENILGSSSNVRKFYATNDFLKIDLSTTEENPKSLERMTFLDSALVMKIGLDPKTCDICLDEDINWPTPRGYFASSMIDISNDVGEKCNLEIAKVPKHPLNPLAEKRPQSPDISIGGSSGSTGAAGIAVDSARASLEQSDVSLGQVRSYFSGRAFVVQGGCTEDNQFFGDFYKFVFDTCKWEKMPTYTFDYFQKPLLPGEDDDATYYTKENTVDKPHLMEAEFRSCHHTCLYYQNEEHDYLFFIGGIVNEYLRFVDPKPYVTDKFDVSRISALQVASSNPYIMRFAVLNLRTQTWKYIRYFFDFNHAITNSYLDRLKDKDYYINSRLLHFAGTVSLTGKIITVAQGLFIILPEKKEDLKNVRDDIPPDEALLGAHIQFTLAGL